MNPGNNVNKTCGNSRAPRPPVPLLVVTVGNSLPMALTWVGGGSPPVGLKHDTVTSWPLNATAVFGGDALVFKTSSQRGQSQSCIAFIC